MADEDAAWRAVLARDRRSDGRFVYAVRSTGVYCRPVCPSRRPRRAQVVFFEDGAAAERAGFRPCRRCGPRDGEASDAERRVRAARAFLEAHAGERVTLARLSAEVGLSPAHLQRTFTRLTGVSPKGYAAALRIERFQARLRRGDDVATAGYGAGYGSGSRVYEQAAARLGMTPGRYRQGGAGLRISFTTAPTWLGRLLVAGTERGLCAVSFGDSDAELVAALHREYPRAELEPDGEALKPWLDAVLARVEGHESPGSPPAGPPVGPSGSPRDDIHARETALPLDVPGTAFQWRVWRALQDIPHGDTRTYAELAAAVGRPGAARAVARACASNHLAVVVPCHRVVATGGGTGGYRWGVERKVRLLRQERDAAAAEARPGGAVERETRRAG